MQGPDRVLQDEPHAYSVRIRLQAHRTGLAHVGDVASDEKRIKTAAEGAAATCVIRRQAAFHTKASNPRGNTHASTVACHTQRADADTPEK